MDTPDTIANGMLALFTKEKSSGVGDYMVSALSGFASFPEDLLVLGRDFLDSDDRGRNQIDKIRLISLIKKGATSDDLKKLINLVINEYAKNLSVEQCSRLLLKLGASSAGSFAFKALFVNQIVSLFFERVIPKFLFSAGMTGILTIGASISRSIYTSYDLLEKNPKIYTILRVNGDLDLLYFIVEKYIDPYLDAIRLQNFNSPLANEVFDIFIEGVDHA